MWDHVVANARSTRSPPPIPRPDRSVRAAILRRPKAYYERLLHSLSHNADPAYGYYMEWAWPIVFGRTPGDCPLPVRPERLVAYTDAMTRLENEYTEATGEKPVRAYPPPLLTAFR